MLSSLAAIVAAGLAESGTVSFSWDEIEGEVPVGLVAAGLAVIIFAAILVYEIWRWLTSLPAKLREEKQHRNEIEGYQALCSGMIAAAAGDALGARANARLAERHLGDRSGLLLLTAQTAQLEGEHDVAQLKFKEMLNRPETEFLGLRGLLANAVHQGDFEEALDLARKAYKLAPATSWVLTTLFDLLIRFEEWHEAIGVTKDLKKYELLLESEAKRRLGLLNFLLAEEAMEDGRGDDAFNLAKSALQYVPDFSPAVGSAAHIALATGRQGQAARFVEQAWRTAPHPELAAIYKQIQADETPQDRLTRFERLAACNPAHSLSHAIMAELALNAGELDVARQHLNAAIETDPRAGHYRLMADLERACGSTQSVIQDMQDRAIAAPPDPQWVCQDTGEVVAQWRLFAPSGRFDAISWEMPPRVAELIRRDPPIYRLDGSDHSKEKPANRTDQPKNP